MDLPSEIEMKLLALVATERSGREAAKKFKAVEGRPMSYGTLYTTFRRLKEAGWVTMRDDADADGRVRYFKITGRGVDALERARRYHERLATFGLEGVPA